MTDKEKALAYDKLLVKAKQIYNKENDVLIMHTIEDLFPEFKESEDERTRKAIIALIEFGLEDKSAIAPGSNITKEEAIAWLEKQGTPAKLSEEGLDDKLGSLRSQPKQGWSEEDEKRLRDTINTIVVYKEDTNVRCCQSELNDCIANINWLKSLRERAIWKPASEMKSPEEVSSGEPVNDRPRDESGPSTDNPKPRFKPGEWIAHNEANFVFQVISVGSNSYEVVNPDGYTKSIPFRNEGDYHRWTAYEAKEGDVVVEEKIPDHPSPFIAIFKEMGPKLDTFSSLCFIDFNGNFNEGAIGHDPSNLHPATKEQRELILKAMIDAGYTIDYDKKKLKKTGENPGKPKFHEGEWIISDTADKDYHICKIMGIKDGNYEIESTSGYKGYNRFEVFDNSYRLWTIDEAKDGDVLAAKECYVIFEEITGLNIRCYCTYHYMGFNPSLSTNTLQNKTAFHPATKEESDTLGKAITNAGLKWDAEKKKLTAIKPRFDIGDTIQYDGLGHNEYVIKEVHYPTHYINELGRRMDMPYTDANFTLVPHEDNRREWSEEDEEIINKINVAIATRYSCDTAVKVENWLKSLKSQPGQGWSKEDEVKLKSVCALIRNTSLSGHEGIEEFTIDWIRSLKDRVQSQSRQEWKQENTGDLTEFENAMMHIGESFFGQPAGLDPNDTSTIKEQANLLLELVPKQEWSEDDEQYLLVCKNALSKYQVTDKWDSSIISQWLDNRLKS